MCNVRNGEKGCWLNKRFGRRGCHLGLFTRRGGSKMAGPATYATTVVHIGEGARSWVL